MEMPREVWAIPAHDEFGEDYSHGEWSVDKNRWNAKARYVRSDTFDLLIKAVWDLLPVLRYAIWRGEASAEEEALVRTYDAAMGGKDGE